MYPSADSLTSQTQKSVESHGIYLHFIQTSWITQILKMEKKHWPKSYSIQMMEKPSLEKWFGEVVVVAVSAF